MRADRLLSILLLLQTRGQMTAQQLAVELEVSQRTIYRDIDALSIAGVPVYAEHGPEGGFALLDSYRSQLTGLTSDEMSALLMLGVPGQLADLGLRQKLQAAFLKLSASLSEVQRREKVYMNQRIYLDSAPWFHSDEPVPHLPLIQQAVWQDRKLAVTYRRQDGEGRQRLIEPYGLVAKAGIWYLVRTVTGRQGKTYMGVYRVSRLQDVMPSDEHFVRADDFDLVAFWQGGCAEFESSRVPQCIV